MVAGTVSALQKRGLRVPQDISVMSIDGFNLAAIQDVPLTAVHVPRDELGTEAVHLLQQRLIRPDAPRGRPRPAVVALLRNRHSRRQIGYEGLQSR